MSVKDMSASGTSLLKVALFGFYGYGNFGDDLMAVIFGRFLRDKGAEVSVYRFHQPYAERYGFNVACSLSELLGGKDLVVVGGGGAFVPSKESRPPLSESGQDLVRLIEQCKTRRIPVYALSVGGSGACYRELMPPYKRALLRSAEYLTVRNPEDVELLESASAKGDFYPDVVWQTPAFFPIKRQTNRRIRVGINVYLPNLAARMGCYVLPLIYLVTGVRRDLDFVFIDTHSSDYGKFRAVGMIGGARNCNDYAFSDIRTDLELLASLDLMISTRLHAGLVCMSYGIPFISLFGERKTFLLMKNTGLIHMYYDHWRIFDLISLMLGRKKLAGLTSGFRVPEEQDVKQASLGHLRELENILNKHRGLRRENSY